MGYVSRVHLCASTLVGWKHEACMPGARGDVVCNDELGAFTKVKTTVVPTPYHVFQRPIVLWFDSVDDIVVDDQLL